MKLLHKFPHGRPCDWPENHEDLTFLLDDGDDTTLYVIYEDKEFRRPMEPTHPDEMRADYLQRICQLDLDKYQEEVRNMMLWTLGYL